ncbi:E3 ubiquitin-protein ligase ubr1, partial [Coemansia sp. RSA 2618]
MDDTCVLCTRCFQATDHTGHDTSFSVNSGTGGCCDCGDPEAWKIPLRCRHHSSFEELEECGLEPIVSSAGAPFVPGYSNTSECPASVRRSIELTIAVVLEFILETFATSPVSLSAHFDEGTILRDAQAAGLAIGDHEPQDRYAIVLWNDEVHSFQDVIDQCTEALQCSHMEAKKMAENVDACGRDVLRVSTSISELIDIATTMTNVSLSVSIRAARDVFREQLSASLLIWLRDLACCKFRPLARVLNGKINNEIRAEISYQLCLRWVAPYRNAYLADALEQQYEYSLQESEFGDEDDDEDGMDEEDQEYYDDEDEDEINSADQEMGGSNSSHGMTTNNSMMAASAYAANQHPMFAAGYPLAPAAESAGEGAYARGLRRRRSESEDSLRHEGEERASPRGFMQAGPEQNDDIPPSIWLTDSGRRNESRVPSTIHAAMGAAADAVGAARTSLARIMHPSAISNYPPHSAAPGAYPSSAIAAESGSEVPMQEQLLPGVAEADADADVMMYPDLVHDRQTQDTMNRMKRGCGQQRVDWFLMFDLQLWKEVRSGLRELYMATLMLDSRYKMKIALTFARSYPRLSRAFLTQDRAPEHSVLLFSVQLFTAPTLSASLVEHHSFLYIILDVLTTFFVQPTPEFLRVKGVILCDTESFRNRRYFHVFHDMRYLAGTPQVRNWVSTNHSFLRSYVGFIGLFQGMNPNCRAALQHVEFEADTWVNAFNVTLQVAKSCRQFAECYGISARDLFFAMRDTLRRLRESVYLMAEENSSSIIRAGQLHGYLPQTITNPVNSAGDMSDARQLDFEMHVLSTLWGCQYRVVKYDVASCPVSFHHPLHWFMAELFQHVQHMTDERARDFGFASVRDMIFSTFDPRLDRALEASAAAEGSSALPLYSASAADMAAAHPDLLRILDYPVRVCVVMAQIRAGLWVRNGYVIRLQSHHYREVSLRENTYDQDVVMIQFFASIWPDTDHILMTLVDRFGLYDWFCGQLHSSRSYEPVHMQYMVEEFLNLLIVIVSERHVATGKNALDLARREIVHGCLSPISYSELSKKVPERLAENTEFDNLLQKMADYRGPTGIMDFGQYELKDEFLDEVDPYFIHYARNQREEVEEVLRERLIKRKRKNGSTDDTPEYVPPKLEEIRFGPFQRIGMVLHTPLACQVLFYSLLHATQSASGLLSETMVDEALQLIILAFEDGQRGAVAREIGGGDDGAGNITERGGLWKYALQQGYPVGRNAPMNLLGLVLTLGLKPEMKPWKSKLDHIYGLLRKGGPRMVSCIDDYYASLEATPMGSRVLRTAQDEAMAAERKKQASKARQAAIMADFASQQQNFISQFGEEFDDLSDDDDVVDDADDVPAASVDKGKAADNSRMHQSLWGVPTGACIVCQEECDSVKPYGMLALVQANRVERMAPLSDAPQVVDILRLPGGLDVHIPAADGAVPQSPSEMAAAQPTKGLSQAQSVEQLRAMNRIAAGAYGANSGLKRFPVMYHERGMAASTCGHLMHTRCFTQYCQGIELKRQPHPTRNHPENLHRKEYLCPLCKSLGNVLLPALPGVADHDPLVAADQDPARFSERARTEEPAVAFEKWLEEDWKPFGAALSLASGKKTDANSTSTSTSSASSSNATLGNGESEAAAAALAMRSGGNSAGQPASAAGSDASMTQATSSFPFSFAEGLADSIPRLDDVIRNASRMPAGLNIQALLSRILPQMAGSTLAAVQGPERLALPLSRYVRWLVERQAAELGMHPHRRHILGRAGGNGSGDGSSRCSTPDAAGAGAADPMPAELEAKYREQMEGYQYMYTRLYEVLQNVQRDNHVGLPSPALFEHLQRSSDRSSVPLLHSPRPPAVEGEPLPSPTGRSDSTDGAYDDDEDDEEEDYMACVTPAARADRLMYEQPQAALTPFLQNIMDHIRVLSAGAGGPTQTAQASGAAIRAFPFDRAAAALFTHSIEILELSQRGTRNPPVFSHEDSRTLPSGTLSDGVPESLGMFTHMLGKIPELHYRAMLGGVAGPQHASASAAQRLHAMISESRVQASASATDSVARTRLDILKDLSNALAPLLRPSAPACSREYASEQSRWSTGHDGIVARPFLMQDAFALFSELSQSLVVPFGLDMWHLVRLFVTAELVRICVAVGDSVLGEYSGAPRALRIAQSLPGGFEDDSGNTAVRSHVPQPWVDAPEARDVDRLSVASESGDASILEASAAGIHGLVLWAVRQMQGDSDSN